ncbi:MAG: sulfatase-like hydrolase/transferase [Saccharofermentanales bacterium]|jgi:hypothetical protein
MMAWMANGLSEQCGFLIHCYIDPATTTYLIQMISAIVITLGVTIGLLFTRLRMSLMNIYVRLSGYFVRLFTKKKDEVEVDEPLWKVAETRSTPSLHINRRDFLFKENRSFKSRLLTAFLVSAAFSFTFMFFSVYEVIALNTDSIPFVFEQIAVTVVLVFVIILLVMCGILMIFRGRVFDFFVSLACGTVFTGYIQANFLNGALGSLTGDPIVWHNFTRELIINTFLTILLFAIPLILRYLGRKLWTVTIRALSGLLIVIQLIAMLSLSVHMPTTKMKAGYLSTTDIYDVAPQHNIVIIVLDRLDNRYIEALLQENPNYFDRLDGFTRFTDNMSFYSQTFPSVTNMFTGHNHFFDRPTSSFMKEAWQTSNFLPRLHESNYTITMYMEKGYTYSEISDLQPTVQNAVYQVLHVNQRRALKELLLLSAYRYAPYAFKPFFWTSSDRFGNLFCTPSGQSHYVTDDVKFFNQLKQEGLSVEGKGGQLKYIHLNGTHGPHNMDAMARPVDSSKTSSLEQAKGCFYIVFHYLAELKRLGKYDDSTIIITGDHGARKDDHLPLDRAIVTALFVKPRGAGGTPLVSNQAPVTTDNFRAFIYAEAGLPYEALGPSYFDVPETEVNTRYLYHRLNAKPKNRMLIYEITGDANDFSNWKLVDDFETDY